MIPNRNITSGIDTSANSIASAPPLSKARRRSAPPIRHMPAEQIIGNLQYSSAVACAVKSKTLLGPIPK